jgi:hypothetical protein
MRTVVLLRSRAAALAVVSLCTALVAVLSLGTGVADATPVSGDCPSGLTGLGTPASPCLIGTAAELYDAMTGINADTGLDGASTDDYQLTANIDATTYSGGTAGAATSFGATEDWSGINWFTGTFDGGGYTISNLNYTTGTFTPSSALPGANAAGGANLGLFRVLNGATVDNLRLQNVNAINATNDVGIGGISVWSFASTITGVAVIDPTVSDGGGGGNAFVGGLSAISYANSFADWSSSTSDGGTSSFSNDMVSGGSMASYNRDGGIAGAAVGATSITDSYVNTALSNPDHETQNATTTACYYAVGGLVGQLGTGENVSSQPVAMANNVISGSIAYETTGPQSFGTQNYTSPTVACATTGGGWTSTNNLVSSGFTYTKVTGTAIAGVDGTSVSPATLETQTTYSGTDTGLTDPTTAATYDDLGWNFGSGGGTTGWAWEGTAPALAAVPTITLGSSSVSFVEGAAQSDSTVISDAGATTNVGTLSIDTSAVVWSTPGTYTATLTATDGGFTSSDSLTIVIASDTVPLATPTGGLEASSTPPTTAQVLTALGASVPHGDGGTLGVEYPDGEPDWDTPGSYTVEVTDTGGTDGLQPTTGTIVVVTQPALTVGNSTIAFSSGTTVTGQDVLDAVNPIATYGAGDSGTLSANILNINSAVGLYTATITATDQYGLTSVPVTVTVAITDGGILLGNPTPVFQVTSAEPSEQAILSALDPVMPAGSTGAATVSGYTAADFQTAGEYTVTVSDSNTSEGVSSVTATVEVVDVSAVTVTDQTVYFNTSVPPTAAAILTASGAEITNGSGAGVSGTLTADVSQIGSGAGTYTATITGTDVYGFTTAPVAVTVDVSAAGLSVAHMTARFTDTGSAPSQAALVSAFGATVTGSADGEPVVNTSGVDWSLPGTYGVIVSDSDTNDQAATETAEIQVVPVPVVTLPGTTVYLPVNANNPLPAGQLLPNSGAALTDGEGNVIAGTLTADTSGVNGRVAGTYSATITGTDAYGFESAPVTVSVVMYESAQAPGTVSITGAAAVGGTLTANLSGWAGLVTPEYQWFLNSLPIPGATSAAYTVVSGDAGGGLSVEVTEAPQFYDPASVTSAVVTVAAASTGTTTTQTTTTATSTTQTTPTETATTSTQPASTPKWTAPTDVLKAGITSTTVMEPTTLKVGTSLTVEVKEAGVKKLKTTKVKVRKAGTRAEYSYKTGKLPAGTTTVRFYKTVGKRLVLVRTENIKVAKKKK